MFSSVPTAHFVPGALSRTVFRMPSVDPIASDFWATSNRHSGWTITLTPGISARRRSTISGVNRLCTEQCPFQSTTFAERTCLRLEPAPVLVGVEDRHRVQRDAHAVAGVPSEVLVGKEEHARLLPESTTPSPRGRSTTCRRPRRAVPRTP